jgi:hypothetical protein
VRLTLSLKRYSDTNQSGETLQTTTFSGEPFLYGDSTQRNERVTAFFQK